MEFAKLAYLFFYLDGTTCAASGFQTLCHPFRRLGRDVAEQRGIQITGILGILILAKKQSLIHEVKPWMDQLIDQANFRIRPSLYQKVLVLAEETIESAT